SAGGGEVAGPAQSAPPGRRVQEGPEKGPVRGPGEGADHGPGKDPGKQLAPRGRGRIHNAKGVGKPFPGKPEHPAPCCHPTTWTAQRRRSMTMADYRPPLDRLLTLGHPDDLDQGKDWSGYFDLGIGSEDIPDLIRMATDPDLLDSEDADSDLVWAPVHAWR